MDNRRVKRISASKQERLMNFTVVITCAALLFCIPNINLFSQTSGDGAISGKVVDSAAKDGLPGVSIYLSGTTIGASSNKDGNYKIGNIPEGNYILVVSMIGYKPVMQNITVGKGTNIKRDFSLEYKAIEMKAIVVSEQSDEYDDYFREIQNFRNLFKKYFLGQTEFSNECEIENIDEIVFDKKFEPSIKASCSTPIVITNRALGYKIECVLLNFMFNIRQEGVSCEFYPKFEELTPADESQKVKWNENRKSAFRSSLRRFLLSNVKPDLRLNNYSFVIPRATSAYKNVPASRLTDQINKFGSIDSTCGIYFLKFKGFLFVNNLLTDEQSMIFLPYGTAYIGSDGYPVDPSSVQATGTFARHGVANMLPIDNSYLEWER